MILVTNYDCIHKGNITWHERCAVCIDGVTGQTIVTNISKVSHYIGNRTDVTHLPALTLAPSVYKQMLNVYKNRGAKVDYDSNLG